MEKSVWVQVPFFTPKAEFLSVKGKNSVFSKTARQGGCSEA